MELADGIHFCGSGTDGALSKARQRQRPLYHREEKARQPTSTQKHQAIKPTTAIELTPIVVSFSIDFPAPKSSSL